MLTISPACSLAAATEEQDVDSETPLPADHNVGLLRLRTVSLCSNDVNESELPSGLLAGASHDSIVGFQSSHGSGDSEPCIQSYSSIRRPPPSTLVGTTSKAPVISELKRKFSWKNYPELEEYLVRHREQYLKYSSQLNYTAEQKLYNNKLTQGLLDLASEKGFIFQGFTFAALRDRIRCYYKSFVQTKKKGRKKRA
ncbi:hypothetical protein ACA910_011310 [Epithemia clementina (nom. ined.)]